MLRQIIIASSFAFLFAACSTETAGPTGGSNGKADDPYAITCDPACEDGYRCFDGACVTELCDDETPCSEGGSCLDGACCYSEEDCGLCDGEDCTEPEPAPACSCEGDNERCFENACVVDLCDDQTPCSDGGSCLDGACCYSEEDCGFCDSEDCA